MSAQGNISKLHHTIITSLATAVLALAAAGIARAETLEGRLSVIWTDPAPGSGRQSQRQLALVHDDGRVVELDASTLNDGHVERLAAQRVVVETATVERSSMTFGDGGVASAVSIRPAMTTTEVPSSVAAVTGDRLWLNILCKFSDVADEPIGPDHLEAIFDQSYPGMGDFWRAQSYGLLNVSAQTLGWYRLPRPMSSYYVSNKELDRSLIAEDCVAAAAADAPAVESIAGINIVYNAERNEPAMGGSGHYTLFGISGFWKVAFLPPWAAANHGVIGHEMGHTFGLGHSTKPGGGVYDNTWDLMSDTWGFANYDPSVGVIGKHLNSYHKELLGWIDESDVFVIDESVAGSSIPLERLADPVAPGFLAAIVAGTETRYLTIEARKRVGYDASLPGDAVIIHDIDKDGIDATLAVAGCAGDVGGPDEMWLPGEVYANSDLGVTIEVESEDATGFSVVARYPVCGDGVREQGVETCDDGNARGGDGCSADCRMENFDAGRDAACLDAVVKAGSKVSQVQLKEAVRCLSEYAAGKSSSMENCVIADPRGKVAKATNKTLLADTRNCSVEPVYGYVGAEAVNDAAVANAIGAPFDLFGEPMDEGMVSRRADPAGARCQKIALRSMSKLIKLQLKEYRSCVKAQTRSGEVASDDAIGCCLAAATYDTNVKIENATLKVRHKIRNSCDLMGLEVFSDTCDPRQTVSQCAERVASCRVCRTASGMNGLSEACDLYDDGEANSTCAR